MSRPGYGGVTFKRLSKKQEVSFRQWARDNYKIGEPIDRLWHPKVRDECNKMNYESLFEEMRKEGD